MNATTLALDHLLRAIGDPLRDLAAIGPGHPDFERAQIIRLAVHVQAKSPQELPAIARIVHASESVHAQPQILPHIAAARAWLEQDPPLAAERYAAIVGRWPRDLLALRLAQSCYFFLGRHDRLCEVVDAAIPAWQPRERGAKYVLAMASFAHAENGNLDYAEALGRQALRNAPQCPIGVHAVAHAIAEAGQHRRGARWMRDQRRHWSGRSRMRTHNAWHLAMFEAEVGNFPSALRVFDGWLARASQRSTLDACDAAALLWRLASAGVDVAGRGQRLSDAFEQSRSSGFWPYVDLHAGLAHLIAGRHDRLQQLRRAVEQCARGSGFAAQRARRITLPGIAALDAWTAGRYAETAWRLHALSPRLREAGGSQLQLQVFGHLQRDAARRARLRADHPHPLADARASDGRGENTKNLAAAGLDPGGGHLRALLAAARPLPADRSCVECPSVLPARTPGTFEEKSWN